MNNHVKSVHRKKKSKSKCPQCDFETAGLGYLKTHIFVKHEKKELKKIKCDLCDYETGNKVSMNNHINKHIRISCDQCDYTATTKAVLKVHVDIKHTNSIIKFTCEKCPTLFKLRSSKRRHFQSSHEGLRHDCNLCDFKATQKGDLKRHVERKHFPKPSQACLICFKEIKVHDMNDKSHK